MKREMFRLRDRLQAYYLRESADIVRSLAAERGAELAGALKTLEEREAALAAVEDRTAAVEQRLREIDVEDDPESGPAVDRLLARLDERERAVRETRQELDTIRAQLDAAAWKSESQTIELAELRAELARRVQAPAVDPALQAELDRVRQELRAREQAEQESAGKRAQLEAWTHELGEREASLARRELRIGDVESHDARRHELDGLAAVLAEREDDLSERVASFSAEEERLEARRLRLTRQEERLARVEEDVQERMREFGLREDEFEERTTRLQLDLELREDRLELEEQRVAELEQRLERRQADLAAYVAQTQQELAGRDRLYPRAVADLS